MMDSVMADFVGHLGPGQIIDRYSLVHLPAGFAKIIIYNNKSNLFVCISEFKERYEEPSLDIKMSVKGFLTVGGHVVNGYSIANDRIPENAPDQHIQVLKFDKCFIERLVETAKCGTNCKKTDEVLQVCLYATKKNKKRKSFVGMMHIAVDNVDANNAYPYSVEAWYKVFPQSSFLAGYPIAGATTHHVNPPSPIPSPTSEKSDSMVSMFISLSCDCTHDKETVPSLPDPNGLSRKNSFTQIAGLMVKLIQKKKSSQRTIEQRSSPSICSSSSMTDFPGNRSSVTNSISLVSQCGDSLTEDKSDCCFDKIVEDTAGRRHTLPRKSGRKWSFPKRISFSHSTKKHESKFQRSEEIICDSFADSWRAPSTIVETPDESIEDHIHESLHGINAEKADTLSYRKETFSRSRKFHSLESDSGDMSSLETEDICSTSSFEKSKDNGRGTFKGIHSLRSIVRSVHEKAKAKSLPLNSTPPRLSKWKTSFRSKQRNLDEEDDATDPDYAFLKNLQNLSFRKLSKASESTQELDDMKPANSTNSLIESLPDTSATPIADVAKDVETESDQAAEDDSKVSVITETNSDCIEHSSACKQKRCLFSQRRAAAIKSNAPSCSKLSVSSHSTEQNSNRSSLRTDSDDEYLTCSERLSSANISTASLYSTVSESSMRD